jgi:hypothetical protein
MNGVLARAACDLKDDSRRWQDIAKDIENEIPIAQCGRPILAVARSPETSAAGPGGYEPRVWPLAGGAFRHPCEASAGFRTDLRNLYQCLVRLARWRATK